LRRDEEVQLITQAQQEINTNAKERPAYDRIVTSNIGLVIKCAKHWRYKSCSFPIEDLVAYGTIGLLIAIPRFKLSFKTKLSTYVVPYIHMAMRHAIRNTERLIRIPCYLMCRNAKKNPDKEVDRDRVLAGFAYCTEYVPSKDRSIDDLINDDDKNARIAAVDSAINRLDERFAFVLRGRAADKTLKELGGALGVSRERVRQMEVEAKQKVVNILRRERPDLFDAS